MEKVGEWESLVSMNKWTIQQPKQNEIKERKTTNKLAVSYVMIHIGIQNVQREVCWTLSSNESFSRRLKWVFTTPQSFDGEPVMLNPNKKSFMQVEACINGNAT